ncbi:MAG: heterocyst differentiation protein HetZ [Oscillatoria sp. PMC 1051.18]|uniref:heterocyst differentiation protein HetZ n=1 Tax=Oscillatoria salina TaxID=331517 RepID=UPI0013B5ECE0|nr:heterocyst differentiation protein HetZ [Oscillatoria salina]MBZ8181719.1 heterocyst differentiation protein HetZ [Oscillatoria salina IIICB1]MEC4892403.1 heterocyst differentiation protein HetZ [Oscillatoria sp. PMC 1050.18]MEC5030146.1 heterocyst differentiation protein HetZ [Oscillatoria sp. PMC 1051.18]NET90361.1 heterocyst differentiation protein HetZ [Kamptonema sp. SIO1D9]
MEAIFQLLFERLKQLTRASSEKCREVAARITDEVTRICQQSRRIQASGDIQSWAKKLALHRLEQCRRYYQLGSKRGRIELQSTLSAIVYRYISGGQNRASYQARLVLIEDFLQGFYAEALNAFRRENQLSENYSPRTLLELAEYMAFSERYAKRRIPLGPKRSQQLIVLRAQTFSQQQPRESVVDMDLAAEGGAPESTNNWNDSAVQQLREVMVEQQSAFLEGTLRETIIEELIAYLEERQQPECINYFILRLQDLTASEIEEILGLTARERDYLQQRFKYHLIRFALSHRWELVHQWLEADLERNLGLTPGEWEQFKNQLNPEQTKLLELKQKKVPNSEIAQTLSMTANQVDKQWFKLLSLAWGIRNP